LLLIAAYSVAAPALPPSVQLLPLLQWLLLQLLVLL
jgi:hypothetical protein